MNAWVEDWQDWSSTPHYGAEYQAACPSQGVPAAFRGKAGKSSAVATPGDAAVWDCSEASGSSAGSSATMGTKRLLRPSSQVVLGDRASSSQMPACGGPEAWGGANAAVESANGWAEGWGGATAMESAMGWTRPQTQNGAGFRPPSMPTMPQPEQLQWQPQLQSDGTSWQGFYYQGRQMPMAATPEQAQQMDKERRLVGTIKRYVGDKSSGYGFIDCEEAQWRYGHDVYIHARQMHRCQVGDVVSFSIVRNAKGEPQARNVCKLEDEEKFLAKLQRDQDNHQSALLQKRQHLSYEAVAIGVGGVLMDEEAAKRFQKSLKRS